MTQQRIQELVPGFKFNLGFSGKYFHHGTVEENLGDDMLLGYYYYRYLFTYLCSTGNHSMIFFSFL